MGSFASSWTLGTMRDFPKLTNSGDVSSMDFDEAGWEWVEYGQC